MVEKQSEAFHTFLWHFFPVWNWTECVLTSRLHFEIHQLWQSGFSEVYSNCCCSCSFEPEIIKIGQSSHTMYSNNILNFQESTTILNSYKKKSGNLLKAPCILDICFINTFFRYTHLNDQSVLFLTIQLSISQQI